MATRAIDIDFRALDGLADGLERLSGERFSQIGIDAVNKVATATEAKFRERITDNINLQDAYVRPRLILRLADNPARPEATIRAPYRHTPLGRYDARQVLQPVKHPKRAKGDPARGIPKGMKQGGVSVEVNRGSRKRIKGETTFTIPKFKDSDGNPMIFRRDESNKLEALYGPSVYQLTRVQINRGEEEIGMDLELAVRAEAEAALEGIL